MTAPEPADGQLTHDASLAARILRGDRAAENQLILTWSGRVFAQVMVRLRDREAARELVDDVLMATVAALRVGTVRDTSHLGAFIHGTTLNLVHNHVRSRSRIPQGPDSTDALTTPDLAGSCERDSDLRALERCIARLPLQDRAVLLLTLTEGLKPGEVAARLGLSVDLVRQHKSRALKRLRLEMLASPRASPEAR